MLTENDRKQLEFLISKRRIFSEKMLLGVIFFTLFMGAVNIWLSAQIAGFEGYSFNAFMERYAAGISSHEQYSGIFIKAVERFTVGIGCFGLVVVQAVNWWGMKRQREQTQRIVETLKQSGTW